MGVTLDLMVRVKEPKRRMLVLLRIRLLQQG